MVTIKRLFFVLVACCCATAAFCQPDPLLNQRLTSFMAANSRMDFEKVLDYTYPKLFTAAPRSQMIEVLKNSFNNDQMTIRLDSLQTDSIYPIFKIHEGSYARIMYSMKMIMHFKTTLTDPVQIKQNNEMMLASIQSQYGNEKVSLDTSGNIVMHMQAIMVAVKDIYSKEWSFVNLKDGDPIAAQLFSKEVLDKLSYK